MPEAGLNWAPEQRKGPAMERDWTPCLDWAPAHRKAPAMVQDWTTCLDWAPAQRKAPAMAPALEALSRGPSLEAPGR